jgi:flavin-dependent dehydrogenase
MENLAGALRLLLILESIADALKRTMARPPRSPPYRKCGRKCQDVESSVILAAPDVIGAKFALREAERIVSSVPIYDAIIIGGGPAGSVVARLLASWGHRVLVLARTTDRSRSLAESIPPSARKLLAAIGVLDAVESAGFPRNRGNTVYWASSTRRMEGFGDAGTNAGFRVYRPDFDDVLLTCAAEAGADICPGADAALVEFGTHDLAAVEYRVRDGRHRVHGRFAIDCSGRSGVVARRGLRVYEAGHRMQAFLGLWRSDAGWHGADHDRTIVETYEDGWAWSLSISKHVRQVAVMVDGATTRTTRGPTIAHAYSAELVKTHHLSALTAGATLDRAWACDASLYSSSEFAGAQFLLIGDAASCIDPLSSFGVKKALASAWLGAVAVHTALNDARRRALALDFFSRREREVYVADLARTRSYAQRAFEHYGHDFWKRRAATPVNEDAGAAVDDHVDRLLRRPSVHRAHERLRASASIQLEWSGGTTFVSQPLVRGCEIVLEDAIPVGAAALRYADGVDLIALGQCASRHRHVPDAFDEYCRVHGDVRLSQFLAALSLLIAEGVLTPANTSVHARRSPQHF